MNERNNRDTLILAFMVIAVIIGFIFFSYELWGREKYPSKNIKIEEKEETNENTVPTITANELKAKMDRKEDFVLVDVQPKEFYQTKHIPTAISIPKDELNDRKDELPKDKEIIVVDAGNACQAAAQTLINLGLPNVKALLGGITEWEKNGYPTVSIGEVTYKNITAEQLKQKIEDKENIMIVDLRSKEAYETGHIQKAVYMPFAGIINKLDEFPTDKDIIFYDETGTKSKLVVQELVKKGLIRAINLVDGFNNWRVKKYPVEKSK